MWVGELDVHVFLFDAGELAMELVGVFELADVEFGLKGADVALAAGAVGVVVIEEAEDGGEFGLGEAWE